MRQRAGPAAESSYFRRVHPSSTAGEWSGQARRSLLQIGTVKYYLGTTTNNVAEYEALRRGVLMAVALGIRDLRIFGDSNLVVKQVSILSDASMDLSSMLGIHDQRIFRRQRPCGQAGGVCVAQLLRLCQVTSQRPS